MRIELAFIVSVVVVVLGSYVKLSKGDRVCELAADTPKKTHPWPSLYPCAVTVNSSVFSAEYL